MLRTLLQQVKMSRQVSIPKAHPKLDTLLRSVRPSLLDWRFTGDAWIVDQGDGTLALRMGDYNMAEISGFSLDLPSLNQILGRVWNRRPRRRS